MIALTLIRTHWRLVLIGLMLGVTWYYKSAYSNAVSELATFKADIATQAEVQKAKNEVLRKQSVAKVAEIVAVHTQQIDTVKAEYEKRNKTNVNTIANLRIELRDKVRADSFALPETPTNPSATTEEWRNSHSAITGQYQTLIDACTITTVDYNALRGWADNACNQVGCE